MSARWITADVFDGLEQLDDNSVDLILSSPPFLALRSYLPPDHPDKAREIGSEPTPAAFLDTLLDLTVEWRRLLVPHGSIAIELGDTYSNSGGAGGDYNADGLRAGQPKFRQGTPRWDGRPEGQIRTTTSDPVVYPAREKDGYPLEKSLCLIPESFRWALVYGRNPFTGRTTPRWRARNVVRWVRPNPTVGALGDKVRPATSELVVACKSRARYFDLDAVRVPDSPNTRGGNFSTLDVLHSAPPLDWWCIPAQGYAGSHYATWPERLCDIPILTMCPQQVCRVCGEPSRRLQTENPDYPGRAGGPTYNNAEQGASLKGFSHARYPVKRWLPGEFSDCGHGDYRRGVVLDPFAGTGTTLKVAVELGRDAVGIDLDPRNYDLARERVGMWLDAAPAVTDVVGL